MNITGRMVGDIVFYSCDHGYQLDGAEIRVCQNNSEWRGDEPICVEEGK